MSKTKLSDKNLYKLQINYLDNGQIYFTKEKLKLNEINMIHTYTHSTSKCCHSNIIEDTNIQISYIENYPPLICQICGLIGYHLEDFSDKGIHPIYGKYYNS